MPILVVAGLAYWALKGLQTFNAYQLAVAEITDRDEIAATLGAYDINYDWWI